MKVEGACEEGGIAVGGACGEGKRSENKRCNCEEGGEIISKG